MGDFKQLKVWQRSREVVLAVYQATENFPESERDGLSAQLRRAATSIASNIAESRGRYSDRDQVRFLRMAQGSAREVECQILIARDLDLIPVEPADNLLGLTDEVQRMLTALIRTSQPAISARTKG
jgi:four helix bundle protein